MAAPEEIDICIGVQKPTPYTVCCGCNGAVQNDAYEVDKEMRFETWHVECYEAENDDGEEELELEEYKIAQVEDGN